MRSAGSDSTPSNHESRTTVQHVRRLHVDGIHLGDQAFGIHVEGGTVDVEGAAGFEVLSDPRPPLSTVLSD